MSNWKIILLWFALIAWRLGSAAILVIQGQENELKLQINGLFWIGYIYLWVSLQYPDTKKGIQKEAVFGEALYCMGWIFLVAITGLALRFLAWVLLGILFSIEVRLFWGEVFAVIFATVCLYIPIWLRRNTVNTQELI